LLSPPFTSTDLLVPKFHLGTQSLLKFYFSSRIGLPVALQHSNMIAKLNFAGECVPK
jgi:hypothetical protein